MDFLLCLAHVGYFIGFCFLDKRPCFCLLTIPLCLTLGSKCLYLPPRPLPRVLTPDSVLLALTLFLSPDHRLLLSHWVCKPDSQCDVALLPPNDHTEELKFSFLILSQILKRGSCAYLWWFPAEHLSESSINLLKLISCVR
ncbi:hypothetical protein GOODEAATRI_018708 [Goodea atripinnis]|uniref:Uncharacterized protein n=1 Tax=Goodea atripinnis TaxID=208336 RepID=A0ABV0NLC3_9TELE